MSRHTIKKSRSIRRRTFKYRGGGSSSSTPSKKNGKKKMSGLTPPSIESEDKIRARAIAIERVKVKIKEDLKKLEKMRIELEEVKEEILKEQKEIADEKERKAAMKPVPPPKLKIVESKVTPQEFEYLKDVLRSLGKLSSHREKKENKIHIYYDLDDFVKELKIQLLTVNKYHKSEGYEFSNEKHRKVILIQLTKYIKYFEYVAFLKRVDNEDLETLFDGIDD